MGAGSLEFERTPEQEVELAHSALSRFLSFSQRPALLEAGDELFPLAEGSYQVERQNHRLYLEAWDDGARRFSRRILALREESPGRLEFAVERFGRREGSLLILDLDKPNAVKAQRKAGRLSFRERVRRMLARRFPDWKIQSLSTEPDLENSLSPVYARALLRKGPAGNAVMVAPPGESDRLLTFALIWLDYLRRRERSLAIPVLTLLVPEGEQTATCLRVPFLDRSRLQTSLYVYSETGRLDWLDPADYGNVDTELPVWRQPPPNPELEQWMAGLLERPGVERIRQAAGECSLRVRGIEFARTQAGRLYFGMPPRYPAVPCHIREIGILAGEIARLRSFPPVDPGSGLYRDHPELWLESQVRSDIGSLDARLMDEPVYGQVVAIAGGERGLIDLLAIDSGGRLAVIELKTAEDPHLPMQALDYWIRIRWHLLRGDFARRGYFPGLQLSSAEPRLILVAPAFEFHPACERVLDFLAPQIEAERIGLGVEWRKRLQVLFRLPSRLEPFSQTGLVNTEVCRLAGTEQ